ncbi:MarR family winged helix-turn-helix transcriptional regulator [Sphingomonas sp.]|jgi:DNA-binding MarR family transcriptional regulator|uniref:MarR family winged helix-turn-helix transcriptional regulator n=1 Tax=Sphingomonas sp. TaxID=28214 RepID=UPI002EDAAA87
MPRAELPVGLGPLEDILGLNIRLAHGAVQRHFGERFADLALTQKQVSVLWLAGDHPGIAQTDLARALDMDRATTMAIVHALEKRGLLERAKGLTDARRVALALTGEGRALLKKAQGAIAEHEQWLTKRFSPKELGVLMELLRRIHR